MKPTTLESFEKELIQHYSIEEHDSMEKSSIQSFGFGRGSVYLNLKDRKIHAGAICKRCGTIHPILLSHANETSVTWCTEDSEETLDIHAEYKYKGTCLNCKKEVEFIIVPRDFANIYSIFDKKGYGISLSYDKEKDTFYLYLKYAEDLIDKSLTKYLETLHRDIPISWNLICIETSHKECFPIGHYTVHHLLIGLERCNYVEGIYDMNEFVRKVPCLSTMYAIGTLINQGYIRKINHPYIM